VNKATEKSQVDLSEFFVAEIKRCIVARAVSQLNETDADKYVAALATAEISARKIFDWLKERNVNASLPSIKLHRSGTCGCNG
jgi:hypothetical protein